jgi:hypothetical protein
MERLKTWHSYLTAAGVACGVVFNDYVKGFLSGYKLPDLILLGISLVLILAFYILSNLGTEEIITRWKWFKKFIMKEQFIEGTWLETIEPEYGEQMISRNTISFERDKIEFEGINYNLNGQKIGSFSTDMVCFKWPNVEYKYNWIRFDDPNPRIVGYGEINFCCPGNANYNGHYFILPKGSRYRISGRKITKKDEIQSLNDSQNSSEIIRIAMKHLEDCHICEV